VNEEWDPDAWGVAPNPGAPSSPPPGASAPATATAPAVTAPAVAAADSASTTQSAPSAPITPGFELRRVQTPSGIQRTSQFGEGSRIGGYLLRECIGQGGMARVYRAEHEGLQRQVAVKVLLEAPNTDGHERFLREARIAAAIKHRNVVNIFDVGVDRGMPYLVMELLEGADLDTFMGGKNRLDEATTMDIIVPITSALSTVHDAGIVHRDLKPGNIFLARGTNDELEPRLLDFGISKSVADQMRLTTTHGPVMGTPFYMSPEAASGTEMTPLSDQYALGVVLYECVTGSNPFASSNNFAEIVHRITSADYEPASVKNPQLSKRMAAIIERAMQLDPARRFPDLRALGRELLLLAGQRTRVTWQLSFNDAGRAPLVEAGPPAALPAPPPRRRRSWLAVAPALALLLVGGAWATGSLERLKLPGLSRLPQRASLADLLPHRSADAAQRARERPQVTLALEPEPAPSDRASSIPAAIASSEPAMGLPIASAQPSPEGSLSGSGGSTPSAVSAADSPAKGLSSKASGAVSLAARGAPTRRNATPRRSTKPSKPAERSAPALEYGTNNAPILD
jgi:serine/threonine protein kinase